MIIDIFSKSLHINIHIFEKNLSVNRNSHIYNDNNLKYTFNIT